MSELAMHPHEQVRKVASSSLRTLVEGGAETVRRQLLDETRKSGHILNHKQQVTSPLDIEGIPCCGLLDPNAVRICA